MRLYSFFTFIGGYISILLSYTLLENRYLQFALSLVLLSIVLLISSKFKESMQKQIKLPSVLLTIILVLLLTYLLS